MISLAPMTRNETGRVAHLTLKPEQSGFAHPVLQTLKNAEATRDFHVVIQNRDVVGFFSIDVNYKDHYDFTTSGDIGLYSFQLGQQFQGLGIASLAAKNLNGYLAYAYPHAKSVVLTVNEKNPAAYACYLSGGFIDTAEIYYGGDAGPQKILRLIL